jgi:hypothetical protein
MKKEHAKSSEDNEQDAEFDEVLKRMLDTTPKQR